MVGRGGAVNDVGNARSSRFVNRLICYEYDSGEIAAGNGLRVCDEGGPATGEDIERRGWGEIRHATHDDAAVSAVFDEPFGFEAAKGLTHGRLGDTPAGRDIFLPQVLSSGDAPGEDCALERFVDDICLRAAACMFDGHITRIRAYGTGWAIGGAAV